MSDSQTLRPSDSDSCTLRLSDSDHQILRLLDSDCQTFTISDYLSDYNAFRSSEADKDILRLPRLHRPSNLQT